MMLSLVVKIEMGKFTLTVNKAVQVKFDISFYNSKYLFQK